MWRHFVGVGRARRLARGRLRCELVIAVSECVARFWRSTVVSFVYKIVFSLQKANGLGSKGGVSDVRFVYDMLVLLVSERELRRICFFFVFFCP